MWETHATGVGIGCGLAGGNWATYEAMLEDFAAAHPHIRCYICTLAGS